MAVIHMEFDYAELGKRIKQERENRNWTQSELAAKSGISDSHISSIERGHTEFSVKYLVKLVNAFGMPIDTLLYDEIYACETSYKLIDDIIKDCSQREIKMLAGSLNGIKVSLRKYETMFTDGE